MSQKLDHPEPIRTFGYQLSGISPQPAFGYQPSVISFQPEFRNPDC
jgi:hypothetical protein